LGNYVGVNKNKKDIRSKFGDFDHRSKAQVELFWSKFGDFDYRSKAQVELFWSKF